MDFNSYDEVINGPNTYKEIARILKEDHSIIIPWNDGHSSLLDVLFTYQPTTCFEYAPNKRLGSGIRVTDLFVSVMRIGSFAFRIDDQFSSTYIAEKLNHSCNSTIEELTILINEVCKNLVKNP